MLLPAQRWRRRSIRTPRRRRFPLPKGRARKRHRRASRSIPRATSRSFPTISSKARCRRLPTISKRRWSRWRKAKRRRLLPEAAAPQAQRRPQPIDRAAATADARRTTPSSNSRCRRWRVSIRRRCRPRRTSQCREEPRASLRYRRQRAQCDRARRRVRRPVRAEEGQGQGRERDDGRCPRQAGRGAGGAADDARSAIMTRTALSTIEHGAERSGACARDRQRDAGAALPAGRDRDPGADRRCRPI